MKYTIVRIIAIILTFLIIIYLYPMIADMWEVEIFKSFLSQDGLRDAWIRTILFSLSSSFFNILVSLFLSISLWKTNIGSKLGKSLVFLLFPVILGNVSIAFVGKVLFSDIAFLHDGAIIKFIALCLVEFWQYGFLYTYLFWLVIQNISQSRWDYALASQLSTKEQIKDIILPSLRNTSLLLFILNLVFTIYEDAKIQFIFKSSKGTNTELISQWLNLDYQSDSLYNVKQAISNVFQTSSLLLTSFLILIIGFVILFFVLYKISISQRRVHLLNKYFLYPKTVYLLSLLIVVLPILYLLVTIFSEINLSFYHLLFPLFVTGLVALLSVFLSVTLGILWRIGWQQTLNSFNLRSILFFVGLFIVQLLPPLALLLVGFSWLREIGYRNEILLYVVWSMGHIILILPLLSSFLAVTHFRTLNKDLAYFDAYHLSIIQIAKDGFLKRYIPDYILAFLVAFSLVWNESIINNLLSDFIPSFVSEMKMSVIGRATDYAKGMSYLLVSITISIIAISIWLWILKKGDKKS